MDILEVLNAQQRVAVTAPGGAILVLAGPGSGKTRVLTHRIAYLVQHLRLSPWQIMAVTFTNKAAREMRSRIERMLGGQLSGLTIGTFHATCARILRRESDYLATTADFVIYDTRDQESAVKQVLKTLNLDEKRFSPKKMLNLIGRAKNELITPDIFQPASYIQEVAGRVYEGYQALLEANNAYDFDDLLMRVVLLFDAQPDVLVKYQERYHHVLVDEFQDTNTAQYALVKRLSGKHGNLFCVGDEDQSIYLFRGADWRNVRRFRDDFPDCTTVLLEQNYRSTQKILDAARAVIQRNPYRTPKKLFTDRPGGSDIIVHEAYNEEEEADYVLRLIQRGDAPPGDYAIMYRTNAQSRRIEDAFVRAGMPYRLVGATRFYGRREVKDVIAYLRVLHNPADTVSLSRIINTPPRGIGAKTISSLQSWTAQQGITLAAGIDHVAQSKPHPFQARTAKALSRFGNLLAVWGTQRDDLPVAELMDLVVEQSGYSQYLRDGTPEGDDRWENIMELRRVAAEFPSVPLSEFLEQVALVSDVDNLTESPEAPTLLTLHAAKGLEFPVVVIVGVEDGVLPHRRSWDEPEQMAEERRLFYVGITRAQNRLYLVHCFRRTMWGDSDLGRPSRFLDDIPGLTKAGVVQAPSTVDWSWSATQSRDSLPLPAWTGASEEPVSTAAPVEPSFRSGQQVRHPTFGKGIVIEAKPDSGDEIITVAFEGLGLKRLLGSMAKLDLI